MLPRLRIFRPSNRFNDMEAKQVALARAAIAEARQMLADDPRPDTFAGRKTQEPFPHEDGPVLAAYPS